MESSSISLSEPKNSIKTKYLSIFRGLGAKLSACLSSLIMVVVNEQCDETLHRNLQCRSLHDKKGRRACSS